MSHTTPKLLDALQQLHKNPLAPIHHSRLRGLKKRQFIAPAEGGGYLLTKAGGDAIGTGDFVVQQRHSNPGKEAENPWNWVDIVRFHMLEEAEKYALLLSVQNDAVYRIPVPGKSEHLIYNFGSRSIERGGVETRQMLNALPDEAAQDDDILFLWRIQRRLSHLLNEGRFSRWEWYGANRYAVQSDADTAARACAAADTQAYEYRTAIEDLPDLRPMVYCHTDEQVDVGMFDVLVTAALSEDDTPYAERRILAAATLIDTWAHDRHTLDALIVRLQERYHAQQQN